MNTRVIQLAAGLAVLVAGSGARAAQLTTPMLTVSGTDRVRCIATNVGTKPGDVTILVKNQFGGGISGGSAACPGLGVGDSCVLTVQATATCYFDVKGKIKASINGFDGTRIFTSLPASK